MMDYGLPLVRPIDAILGAAIFVGAGEGACGKAGLLHIPFDEHCLLAATRYAELNPVRAGWSSRPELIRGAVQRLIRLGGMMRWSMAYHQGNCPSLRIPTDLFPSLLASLMPLFAVFLFLELLLSQLLLLLDLLLSLLILLLTHLLLTLLLLLLSHLLLLL
jgi:hypothetical protein